MKHELKCFFLNWDFHSKLRLENFVSSGYFSMSVAIYILYEKLPNKFLTLRQIYEDIDEKFSFIGKIKKCFCQAGLLNTAYSLLQTFSNTRKHAFCRVLLTYIFFIYFQWASNRNPLYKIIIPNTWDVIKKNKVITKRVVMIFMVFGKIHSGE